ncbi:MAG: SDR family NAD(P)-dependent oxidoreductase [Pseudomonadota bacterium]
MQNFENTVGFITGGAGGIGLGVARAVGLRGMHVILADLDAQNLANSAEALSNEGISVATEILDVTDTDRFASIADSVFAQHGKLNFLFNNAGVACPSPPTGTNFADWRWVIDVNLMGVVRGVELFLQRMLDSGEPGYIINTASLAGHVASPEMGSYTATKFAVVGYSESLRMGLADTPIDVSVLAPAWVKTRIAHSMRNHPDKHVAEQSAQSENPIAKVIEQEGISVDELASRVIDCMASKTLHIFSHPEFWPLVEKRLSRVRTDYAQLL